MKIMIKMTITIKMTIRHLPVFEVKSEGEGRV